MLTVALSEEKVARFWHNFVLYILGIASTEMLYILVHYCLMQQLDFYSLYVPSIILLKVVLFYISRGADAFVEGRAPCKCFILPIKCFGLLISSSNLLRYFNFVMSNNVF